MTGLQADWQDGCNNYTGIFFPCSALLVTACYCVSAVPEWDPGLNQGLCMAFFAAWCLPCFWIYVLCSQGLRMGQIWPNWDSPSPALLHVAAQNTKVLALHR